MLKRLKRLKSNKGMAHIEACIGLVILMMGFAFFLAFTPVFMMKFTLDGYANELVREAEIDGYVGASTTGARLTRLNDIKRVYPTVTWSRSGYINIGQEVTVTCSKTVTVTFFGAHDITLSSTATGKSEVYHK